MKWGQQLWGIKFVTWAWKFLRQVLTPWGFPDGSVVKNLPANAGDVASGWGRSPGEGNSNPLQYSCLRNPMDEEPGGLQSMGSQKNQT